MQILKRYFGWPDIALGAVVALSLTYCMGSPGVVKPQPKYQASLAEGINFSRPGSPIFIKKFVGLAGREDWGRWSDQDAVILEFAKPLPKSFALEFRAKGFGPNIGKEANIVVGGSRYKIVLTDSLNDYHIAIVNNDSSSRIEIYPPKPASPNSINPQNLDTRNLGIGLANLKISPL